MSTKQSRKTAARKARQRAAWTAFKRHNSDLKAPGPFEVPITLANLPFDSLPERIKQKIVEGFRAGRAA